MTGTPVPDPELVKKLSSAQQRADQLEQRATALESQIADNAAKHALKLSELEVSRPLSRSLGAYHQTELTRARRSGVFS